MDNSISSNKVGLSQQSKFLGIVFFYMGIGLLITSAVAALFGWIFTMYLPPENFLETYYAIMIVSSLLMLGLMIWINVSLFKGSSNLMLPFVLYATVMGVVISSFCFLIPFYVIAIAFGLTCLCFGSMALIGWFSKGNLNILLMIGSGIIIGAMMIGLFNFFFYFFFPDVFNVMYTIISFACFIGVMLITCWDVYNIKKIANSGQASPSLAMFCAFRLYVDFIYIFLRMLIIVTRMSR